MVCILLILLFLTYSSWTGFKLLKLLKVTRGHRNWRGFSTYYVWLPLPVNDLHDRNRRLSWKPFADKPIIILWITNRKSGIRSVCVGSDNLEWSWKARNVRAKFSGWYLHLRSYRYTWTTKTGVVTQVAKGRVYRHAPLKGRDPNTP